MLVKATRKLLIERAEGDHRPISVGFWLSLSHSTVVFARVLLLTLGIRAVAGQLVLPVLFGR